MSRTFKDKPSKLLWGDYTQDYVYNGTYYTWRKTTKPKVKRHINTNWAWCNGTPSWWNNLFHTRPTRRNFQRYFRTIVKSTIESIPDMLEPSDSRKPHKYYY